MTHPSSARERWPRLSLEALWIVATLAVICAGVLCQQVHPHDLWWHLRAGHDIVTARTLPQVETLSFTVAGQPLDSWAAYWLAEIAMYGVVRLGGLDLLLTLQAALITLAYGLLLAVCRRASGNGRLAALCTLFAALVGLAQWGVRPQALGFPLLALVIYAIDAYRRGGARA